LKTATSNEIDPCALTLSSDERLRLALFLWKNPAWARRYSLPMMTVVERYLQEAGFQIRRVEKVMHHAVWQLVLIPASRSCPRSKDGVAAAVRAAFRFAGHTVPKDSISVMISGERITVTVAVTT